MAFLISNAPLIESPLAKSARGILAIPIKSSTSSSPWDYPPLWTPVTRALSSKNIRSSVYVYKNFKVLSLSVRE